MEGDFLPHFSDVNSDTLSKSMSFYRNTLAISLHFLRNERGRKYGEQFGS